jgi:hypothetical protein
MVQKVGLGCLTKSASETPVGGATTGTTTTTGTLLWLRHDEDDLDELGWRLVTGYDATTTLAMTWAMTVITMVAIGP